MHVWVLFINLAAAVSRKQWYYGDTLANNMPGAHLLPCRYSDECEVAQPLGHVYKA